MQRLFALSLASALGSCSQSAPAPTEVVVVVDSDLAVPGELDRVVFRVAGPSGSERWTLTEVNA